MKIWDICKKENLEGKYKLLYDTTTWIVLYTGVEVVDWSKVAVDTKILVANFTDIDDEIVWKKRHFAKYENGKIYAWNTGFTSFTIDSDDLCTSWDFVKLYKEEN